MTPHRSWVLVLVMLAAANSGAHGADAAGDRRSAVAQLVQAWGQAFGADEPVKCGLPVLSYAVRHQATLGAQTRAQLAGILDTRPSLQTSVVVGGGYRIHFDTTGSHAAALLNAQYQPIPGTARQYVDSAASILLTVLAVELGTLGYGAPPSDGTAGGGPEYDIYIQDLGNMYGYTTPDFSTAPGGMSTTYVTIDNDFSFVKPNENKGIPALKVTIAHEFFHAIQIGRYGFWADDVSFYEMSATWMEDVVYTHVNDYINYLRASWSHFRQPERSFASDDLIMYSRCTWAHYLAKRFGVDGVRACWEEVAPAPPQRPNPNRPLRAIDNALRRYSSDFPSAFAEWAVWNYFTGPRANPLRYYPEGEDYPLITQTPIEYTPPSRDVKASLDILGTKYYQVLVQLDTMTSVLVNVDLEASLQGSPTSTSYEYLLRSQKPDESFKRTPIGLYDKLVVPNEAVWRTWYLMGDTVQGPVDPGVLQEGKPFPSPFRADGQRKVYIPVDATQNLTGQLFVFSSAMELMYESQEIPSTSYLGRPMFTWDGKTTYSEVAPTGVYIYVIQLRDRRVTGKIALIKE